MESEWKVGTFPLTLLFDLHPLPVLFPARLLLGRRQLVSSAVYTSHASRSTIGDPGVAVALD